MNEPCLPEAFQSLCLNPNSIVYVRKFYSILYYWAKKLPLWRSLWPHRDDLIQNLLMLLHGSLLRQLLRDPPDNIESFLLTVWHRRVIDSYRKESKRQEREAGGDPSELMGFLSSHYREPLEEYLWQEEIAEMNSFLGSLGVQLKTICLLRYEQGETPREIASRLGIDVKAIYNALRRIKYASSEWKQRKGAVA